MTYDEAVRDLLSNGYRVTAGGCTDASGAAHLCDGISVRTLRSWNMQGKGPPRIEYPSGLVLYPIAELLGWREAYFQPGGTERQSTAKSGSHDVAPTGTAAHDRLVRKTGTRRP